MLLHFFVEEPSAEVALIELVPRILAGHSFDFDIFPFQGKHDLLRKLPNRLKAYQRENDERRVMVLLDRDNEDCLSLKQQLEAIAQVAQLPTRTSNPQQYRIVNRIIIEELEAWFFGDVQALVQAYPRLSSHLDRQEAFRDPDAIKGGTWEQLEKLLIKANYHPGGLEKMRAAEDITRHMEPERNRSKSFQVFRGALLELFVSA